MTFLSFIMLMIKNIPAIESFVSAAWLGWKKYKASYYQELAEKAVQSAIASESTTDISSQLGRDL